MRDARSKLIRRAHQLGAYEEMFTRSSLKVQGRYEKLLRELEGAALKGRTCRCSSDSPQEMVMTEEVKFLICIYLISIALLTLEKLNKMPKENTQLSLRTMPTRVRT